MYDLDIPAYLMRMMQLTAMTRTMVMEVMVTRLTK